MSVICEDVKCSLVCNCPLQVASGAWCIFSRVVWLVEGVRGRWHRVGLETVVYKACAVARAPLEEHRVLPFPSSCSPVCLLETCPSISTRPPTPQKWGSDAPSLYWRQEETPKVSRGWCSLILWQLHFKVWAYYLRREEAQMASCVYEHDSESQPAVEALASILKGTTQYHINTAWHQPWVQERKDRKGKQQFSKMSDMPSWRAAVRRWWMIDWKSYLTSAS